MNTRILLVDDQKVTRKIITAVIRPQPNMVVVAEAVNGLDAFKMARELEPDVIIMDINMPVLNGIHATRLIVDDFPDIKVIGLSIYSPPRKKFKRRFICSASVGASAPPALF